MPHRAGQGTAAAKINRNPDAVMGRSHALLFYQLARFLVWAQQHQAAVATDSALQELVSETASLLKTAGTQVSEAGA